VTDTAPGLFRCRNCLSCFKTPSFSEGPKVVDQETLQVIRFTQARHLCPVCLSPEITPPSDLAEHPVT
jgi:hypothetical protein